MNNKIREILVGNHIFYLDESDIFRITIVGKIDDKQTGIMFDAISKLQNMVKGEVNILATINKAVKPSAETRQLSSKFYKNKKVGKIAIFGLNPVAKVIADFVVVNNKKKDIKFFNSKESALTWLKQ